MTTMRISDGTDTIDFSPSAGYIKPDDMAVTRLSSINGTEYSYKRYRKRKWEIPLSFISTANASTINGWWNDLDELTFYPDMVFDASTAYIVRIRNDDRPLGSFPISRWEDALTGAMILREI